MTGDRVAGGSGPDEPDETARAATVVEVPTAEAMRELGNRMAALLRPGDLVVLSGSLGAGKTTLTQGIGAGLDVRGPITSPTFVIARVHPPLAGGGGPPLVHADAYRLAGLEEIDDLDLDASIEESVTVVEWGAGLVENLTQDRLDVVITMGAGETRTVRLTGIGKRWSSLAIDVVCPLS